MTLFGETPTSFPSIWPFIGILLVFAGFVVDFEVKVITSDDKDGIKGQEEVN